MSFSNRDISILSGLVSEEQGRKAVSQVSGYVDLFRREGDQRSAKLWSMVLARLFHESITNGTVTKNVSLLWTKLDGK